MQSLEYSRRLAIRLRRPYFRNRIGAAAALLSAACSSNDATSQQGHDAGIVADSGFVGSDDSGTAADVKSAVDSGSSAEAAGSDGGDAGVGSEGGDAALSSDGGPVRVSIQFKATVGAQAFACGTTYPGQGSTGASVEPRDFRFYVHDVRLVDDHGHEVPVSLEARSPWQTPDVALLDFENGSGACAAEGNPEMNDLVTGTVPAGTYSGIVFRNGVPDALNHGDPLNAPAPLQPAAMTWGWLFGYKFVKAELAATGHPTGDAAPGLGLLHLGSVGCSNPTDDAGNPNFNAPPAVACTQANRNEIRLTGFHLGSSVIVADIGAIFRAVDLTQDHQCHSEGPSCPSMFAAAGVDTTTGAALVTQSVYRVE
jgi:uncharacterized repeat protein (TIGR04052 family)